MIEFPKWLYSKDHGSVVVDSATDAMLLPEADWFTSPTFEGEPAYAMAKPGLHADLRELHDLALAAAQEALEQVSPPPHIDNGTAPAINAALAKIEATETVKVDRRTKEYREAQKP